MRRRQLAAAAAAGLVLVAGGGVAYAQAQGSSGSYRTATVTVGDVDETLALSGTVTASARQDLSFGAAGTVKKVTAAAGATVAAGDVLATLDPTDLETAVTKARATWAKAKAQLESDQTSQASTVTAATTSTATSSSTSKPSGTASTPTPSATPAAGSSSKSTSTASPALTAALATLADQQSAVTTAQTSATEAISAAKAALAAQTTACAVTPDDPADASADTGDTPAESAATGLSEACTDALDTVQAAQDVVAQKQDALQAALQALSTTLTAAVRALGESATSGTGSTTPTTPSAPSTPTESTGSSDSSSSSGSSSQAPAAATGGTASGGQSGGGGTVTAATLAQDQAAIDTAKAELTEAKRALEAATLTAPFSGEILSVSIAKGDTVAASDVVVIIKGDGGTTVETTVTLDQIDEVDRGQTASVTPAGASEPVTGTVTSIGLLPDSSADGDTSTYPVTIDLDGDVAAPEGATASVQLVIGTATDVLTVPSSAVSTTGRTLVSVLTDGQPVITPVTVGVVGATRTSITEGLKDGQEVVLADLDAALPSGDSTTTRLPGSGGGFGGGMPPGMTRPTGVGGGRG